ncbi:MAG TPA: hypothetical protein VJX67_11195 [Blastocatellia bacterium]|nr:hypothetical protein [Blastocatellia bacterium]
MEVEKKYKALRIIATIYKVLAFVVLAICVIGGLVMLAAGIGSGASRDYNFGSVGPAAMLSGFVGALVVIIYGVVLFVMLYGAGEFIYVFLDIEENTRLTNSMLSGRR